MCRSAGGPVHQHRLAGLQAAVDGQPRHSQVVEQQARARRTDVVRQSNTRSGASTATFSPCRRRASSARQPGLRVTRALVGCRSDHPAKDLGAQHERRVRPVLVQAAGGTQSGMLLRQRAPRRRRRRRSVRRSRLPRAPDHQAQSTVLRACQHSHFAAETAGDGASASLS